MNKQSSRTAMLGAVLVFGLLFLIPSFPVMADIDDCTGMVGGDTVDNLRVPQNAVCTLKGTQVKGSITVEPNATLYVFNAEVSGGIRVDKNATLNAFNVRVTGDIEAENATQVSVFAGSSVGGSIRVLESGATDIDGVEIGKDLVIRKTIRSLKAVKNVIRGDLHAFHNTGRATIINNTIKGNLECQGNVFTPEGGGNAVSGSMEGQCQKMDSPPPSKDDCCTITK